ncbi:radical SAM protein [Alsobacter sp. SYSU M60028]|uniref:Radical SAM protein n=1 Tax=Alsobacter ponti TaxID=2962936 RepID=A0ABT1L9Y6_9HYPH|nr:radical SAM protein [Alsobacter ponti]MCP8937565.1 radical SAM protein [Alsobacter ponti]
MACVGDLQFPRTPAPVPPEKRNGATVKRDAVAPQGLYRPRYRRTPAMRSPDYVQLSTAAAITLGLIPGRMHRCACTHCLNLLLTYPEGCRANCAYCGLARHREANTNYADRNFIRADWPAAPLDEIVARIADAGPATPFQRMCISMITHPASDADALTVLERWTSRIPRGDIPVSILSNPTTMTRADVARMLDLGADIFTVALDACTPEIFERTRGKGVDSPHSWGGYWRAFEHARELFGPGRVGMHLIVGLGETDRDVLDICRRLHAVGGHSHLFCFYPERGSLMDHVPAPPRARWRRVQLARYLLEYADHPFEAFAFSAGGELLDFGMAAERLDAIVASGLPFRTSGCPGKERPDLSACDRPYGDGPPSDIASYPFQPNGNDLRRIRAQLARRP